MKGDDYSNQAVGLKQVEAAAAAAAAVVKSGNRHSEKQQERQEWQAAAVRKITYIVVRKSTILGDTLIQGKLM